MSGPNADQAVTMYNQVISATSDAVFSGALSGLDDYLALATSMHDRLGALEKEQARLEALVVFREPIEVFWESVAEGMGRACWRGLFSELYLEHFKLAENQLVRQDMAKLLVTMNMDIRVWDDVRQVADAGVKGFHQGTIHPMLLKASISQGALPDDLRRYDASMSAMLDWLIIKMS